LLPASNNTQPVEKKTKTVLLHWDAHRDFSAVRHIDQKPAIKKWLEEVNSQKPDLNTMADMAGALGIANYIVPAIFEGLVDEVILVIPPHIEETDWPSVEEYSTTITLGVSEDGKTLGYWSDDKTIQNCATGYCSKDEWIKSHSEHTRTITVWFVSAEKIANNPYAYINPENNVIFNFDIDIFGTFNIKKAPLMPNYDLAQPEYSALLSQLKSCFNKIIHNVKVISIAQSPNFSRESGSRKPLSDLINIFTPGNSVLPAWAKIEQDGL
jgi:hypothetical protein